MNNTTRLPRAGLLGWLFLALMLAALVLVPAAMAQAATDSAGGASAATPWWSGPEVISAIIALATGLIAVWSHKGKTDAQAGKATAEKVSQSLVLAIEAASKIPAVADKEKQIKQAIQQKLTDLGVQPLVHRIVQDVT